MALPTGTVTFLFTDIEGSTKLTARLGDAYAQILQTHHGIIREAIKRHGGHEVGVEGDGFFVAFEKVTDAIAAAVDSQLDLTAHPWPDQGQVRVRMGIHAGEARVVGDNYVGIAVHEASRISSAGHGGQILASKLSIDLAGGALPPLTTARPLGFFQLKDITAPEEIFQIEHPDLPTAFPPLRTRPTIPNNLPPQLTSFVGRDIQRAEIVETLSVARLLTLTGPGGVGKTRLSIDAASLVRDNYPDGVWMTDLAPLSDGSLVPAEVAQAVGLHDRSKEQSATAAVEDRLIDFLRDRNILLLFDNCEHLAAACAATAESLIRSCANLRILASSREPLGVTGEVVYPVPPMSAPDDDGESSEAIQLFIDRVRMHDANYVLADSDMVHVIEICRRLDGLPLAIELAAAHMRALSPKEIAERLEDRFAFLSRGPRTATSRQQTLRGALDWGYDLLSEPERVLLSRLSVFSGGFTLEAAEQICSGGAVGADDVYTVLSLLVDKSLVMRSLRAGRTRFWLLETIREYGRDKLSDPSSEAGRAASRPAAAVRSTSFVREGDVWAIGAPGGVVRLKDSKGLGYLAILIAKPGQEIGVLDLVSAAEGPAPERGSIGDAGEVLDAQAVAAYRRRLADIEEELAELKVFGDADRVAVLENEAAQLSRELVRGLGLGGRHRKSGSTVERARMSVTKAIRSAMAKIGAELPELGRHLDTSIRTGTRCGYFPAAGGPDWEIRT